METERLSMSKKKQDRSEVIRLYVEGYIKQKEAAKHMVHLTFECGGQIWGQEFGVRIWGQNLGSRSLLYNIYSFMMTSCPDQFA